MTKLFYPWEIFYFYKTWRIFPTILFLFLLCFIEKKKILEIFFLFIFFIRSSWIKWKFVVFLSEKVCVCGREREPKKFTRLIFFASFFFCYEYVFFFYLFIKRKWKNLIYNIWFCRAKKWRNLLKQKKKSIFI